jgi:hypothetical protein
MLKGKLNLGEWWGPESVKLSESCYLFEFKQKFMEELLKNNLINNNDLDIRNKTAHIKIADKTVNPYDHLVYESIDNKLISIVSNDIKINENFVGIKISSEQHLTLIFKKNIGSKRLLIVPIIHKIFRDMDQRSDMKNCVVCLENDKNCFIDCGHLCLCLNCSYNFDKCPICRKMITMRKKVYDS